MNIKVEDVQEGDLIRATHKKDSTFVVQFIVTEIMASDTYYDGGVSCRHLDDWIHDDEYNLELIKRPVKVPTKPYAVVENVKFPDDYVKYVLHPNGIWHVLGEMRTVSAEHIQSRLESEEWKVVSEGIER